MAKSLYVHIPFCSKICSYCDFTKLIYNKEWSKQYLDALFYELETYNIEKVSTLYIGGGTPSSLDAIELSRLLEYLHVYLDKNTEFTIEVNAESVTEEKVRLMADFGINRVSIGVESTISKYLKLMGRNHTFDQVKECITLFRKYGITNINVDLIYALPGQSLDELKIDVDNLLSLDVPHISTYSLILEEGTKFYNDGVKEASQDIQANFYEYILNKLREAGYARYEVSNFAKKGYYSRHNLTYWKNEEYYGVGLGASGYLNKVRYTNTKNLKRYLNKEFIDVKEEISLEEEKKYFVITNLRLEEGFSLSRYKNLFSEDFLNTHFKSIKKLTDLGLLKIENDSLKTTDKGLLLLDSILVDLI